MKVNREKLSEAIIYLSKINTTLIHDIDFSEYFTGDLTDAKRDFMTTGLSNTDFIFSDFIERGNYKNIRRIK